MIFYALICLSIILLSIGYCAIFRRRFEETVALAVLTDILVVYAFGFIDHLTLGPIAAMIISLGVMVITLCITISRGDGKELAGNIFTLGFVVFLVALPIIYIACKDMTFAESGSTTQVTRNIELFFSNESMSKVAVASFGKLGWQPGYSLWGYMFTALNAKLDEGMALGGASVFTLAMILPILKKFNWKSIIVGLFTVATMLLIPWLANMSFFGSLNSDAAASLIMAFMLMAFLGNDYCGYGFISVGLGCAVLCITEPGIEWFAAVMILIVIVDIAALGFKKIVPLFEGPRWFSIVLCVAMATGSFLSWWIFAARNGINRMYDMSFFTEERSALFATNLDTIKSYFFKGTISGMPVYAWIILLALLGAVAALLEKKKLDKIRTGVRAALALIGYGLLTLGITCAFTYCFPIGADYTLYVTKILSGYVIAAILFEFSLIIESVMERFSTYYRLALIALFGVVLFTAPVSMAFSEMFSTTAEFLKTLI